MSDRELDDYTIHNAIIMELQKRGFRVIDSGEESAALAGPRRANRQLDYLILGKL